LKSIFDFIFKLVIVGLVGQLLIVSLYADSNSNESCSSQEQISQLHNIAGNVTHTETGTLYDGSGSDDDNDYYYFKPGIAGTLTVSYSSDENTDFYLSTTGCGDNRVGNNIRSYSNSSSPMNIAATDTVYIRIKREKSNDTTHYSIVFNFTAIAEPPVMGNEQDQNINNGSAFSLDISAYVTPNDPILSYTLTGALPTGLLFNSTTGLLSGTPTVDGVFNLSVTATDKDGASNSDSFTITVSTVGTFTCANPENFKNVYNANVNGDIKLIGNTNICMVNSSGQCIDPGNTANNNIDAHNKDGDTVSTTTNSSSAKLELPAGAKILWAGLFWQGYHETSSLTDALREKSRTMKLGYSANNANLNIPYTTVTADELNWVYFSASRWYYQGYAVVTDMVKQNGVGWYWGADINLDLGTPAGGTLGAWSIAIAYEDQTDTIKNLTIYKGYLAFANSGDTSAH